MWDVRIRNKDMQTIAQVDQFSRITIVLKFNQASTWNLEYFLTPEDSGNQHVRLFQTGMGVIIRRDGKPIISGPITNLQEYYDGKQKKLMINGEDDTGWLGRRVALPVVDGSGYEYASHDERSGVAETIMKAYVDYNAGPHALINRRIPKLMVETDMRRGNSITGKARFNNLLDLIHNLALAGGGLGFRVLHVDDNLVFQVYQPENKLDTVKFSIGLGNLLNYSFKESLPSANYIYMGGQGEMTERTFYEGGDENSMSLYGRIEAFKDQRNESEGSNLSDWLGKELEENKESYSFTANVSDTGSIEYGDYNLGDMVTAYIGGRTVENVIREIKFIVDQNGEKIEPVIGSTNLEPDEPLIKTFKNIKDLNERVESLEAA